MTEAPKTENTLLTSNDGKTKISEIKSSPLDNNPLNADNINFETLKKIIFKSLTGVACIKLISMGLVFASSVLLARILGPSNYGAYIFIISVINTLALISYLGLPPFITRKIAEYEQSNNWDLIHGLLRRTLQVVITISILLMIIVAVISFIFSSSELDRWYLLLISQPLLPFIALIALTTAILRGFRRAVLSAVPDMIIRPIAFLAGVLYLVLIDDVSVNTVILIQIFISIITALVGFVFVKSMFVNKIKLTTINYKNKEWISTLLPFMGLACTSFFNVEFINIFLGISNTNQSIAIFQIAANLALFVALPLTLIESVIAPYITRLYYAEKLNDLERLTNIVSVFSLVLSLIPAIILIFYGSEIIKTLYGEEYAAAYNILVIIVLGYLYVNVVGLSMQLLYATEYHNSAFRISVQGAIITVLACLILIPTFGAIGAGIVLGFGKAIRATLFAVEARRLLKIKTSIIW